MPKLVVSKMDADMLDQAYPLVRRLARITLEQWEQFGHRLIREGGGVLAVRAEDRQVHGVAAYLPVSSLKHGVVLRVESIATFELSHASPVRSCLFAALEELAAELGCGAVMISLDAKGLLGPGSRRRTSWESLGLSLDTVEFTRAIDAPAPRLP